MFKLTVSKVSLATHYNVLTDAAPVLAVDVCVNMSVLFFRDKSP
jgi:hypothetical protein